MRRAIILFCLPLLVIAGLMPSASALQNVTLDRLVSDNPSEFTPQILDGEVDSIAQVGQWIVLGGSFTQAQAASGGPVLTRNHILAFDKDTGAISSSFAPSLSDDVKSLATGPNGTVYAGGRFNTVSGVNAYKITQLNLSNGAIASSFKPKTVNAIVQDVQYIGGRLFIGGQFTTIGGVSRLRLAELNPTTGALLPFAVPVEGTHFGGQTQIYHMDVNPAATKMVLAGNFTSVGGQPRTEVAMVDLTSGTVANWQTSRYEAKCYDVFQFIVRDVEFSPDGSYFTIGTTGGYGSGSPSMCDSISRWESSASGTGLDPTWIDYTGGDSTYTTAVTGSAIYVGGHQRWFNNPAAADNAGPGAVARQGIAALDPVNGLPLSWNPGRVRGQGVFAMLATTEGLFIGSDTDQVHGEYHAKVAFFPLAGGSAIPQPASPSLPVTLNSLGDLSTATSNVLYRVNTGGTAIPSSDAGPDWSDDSTDQSSLRNDGSNTAAYGTVPNVDSSVPAGTPSGIFSTERWDPSGGNELSWAFPVPQGTNVSVRLYFANRCSCTGAAGQRTFNVNIDGTPKLSNYDIVADKGDQTGEMKSFDVTSDGTVNIDFGHVTENPLVNGIEIINKDTTPVGADQGVKSRRFTGTTVGSASSVASPGTDFSGATGAFMAQGNLYTAWSDGHLSKQTFDGTSFGAPQTVDLNGLTNFASEMRSMTGLFYDSGRIYYTLAGSSALYSRYFTVEDDVVGAGLKDLAPFKVADTIDGVDANQVRGMTFAGGKLYYANRTTGNLMSVGWSNGAPVAGSTTLVSGPAKDSIRWAQKALFARASTPNQLPTAKISASCTELTCSFDGTGSSDPEGPVTYRWDFGDGQTSTEAKPTHTYAAGSYTVTLSVTDNDGASSSATKAVQPQTTPNQPPKSVFTYTCSALSCHFESGGSSDPDGQIVSRAWDFGDGGTSTATSPDHTFTAGPHTVSLTVKDDAGATTTSTQTVTVSANQVSFVGSAGDGQTASVKSHAVKVPAGVAAGDTLVSTFTSNAPNVVPTTPSGWTRVGTTTTSGMLTYAYTKQATAADAGSTVTVATASAVKGLMALTAYRGAAPVTASDVTTATETTSRATHTTPAASIATSGSWVSSVWADKTAATTTWATPSGQVSRQLLVGSGAGHPSLFVTDTGGGVAAGNRPGVAATADSASSQATMATIVVRPAG